MSKTVAFREPVAFGAATAGYDLLPFRFARLPGVERLLLTNEVGEFTFLPEPQFEAFVRGDLPTGSAHFDDLAAKHFLYQGSPDLAVRLLSTKYRTKKAFISGESALHIFVVSLRCDHSCHYCQVSRQSPDHNRFDMTEEAAALSVARMFDSRAKNLTVEFQGGEPLLAFPTIRRIVADIEARNQVERRAITYTITSTLHHLTDEMLEFFKAYRFQISTSLDGPEQLHNANRPTPSRDAFARTLAGISRARAVLGSGAVAALTTLTRRSLEMPEAIIDEYVRLGFRSVFLRPLSPYGFAVRADRKIGYQASEFLRFHERALQHIISLNARGVAIEEAYTATLLTHILTPFSSTYVDLRSPVAAGRDVLVYNYDGGVYASDESRMLAEMGDNTFRLGHVSEPRDQLMKSQAIELLAATGVADVLPGCSDCAFLPYCGADPIVALATQGDPVGHRAHSAFCQRHMGMFETLFRYLAEADATVMRIFLAWIERRHPDELKREAEAI